MLLNGDRMYINCIICLIEITVNDLKRYFKRQYLLKIRVILCFITAYVISRGPLALFHVGLVVVNKGRKRR